MSSSEPKILIRNETTYKIAIVNPVNTSFSRVRFNKDKFNTVLDTFKNGKEQGLVYKKQNKLFWLERILITFFIFKNLKSVTDKCYLKRYDEKINLKFIKNIDLNR